MENLQKKAYRLRRDVLDMICHANSGHIGGDFSEMEILVELYCCQMNINPACLNTPDRDRFILSKGHSVESLYAVLADCGFFPNDYLQEYLKFGSKLIGHPNNSVPGIEMNTGSLGHGLSLGVGMALAGKRKGASYRTYVVMGDGELAEGSVWEAAMCASHYSLDNLCATVDRNKLQISGKTESVMNAEPLADRFRSFGWNVIEVHNGNDILELHAAYNMARYFKGKPTIVIAETTKGCGVSFMENQPKWHHKVPNTQEFELAARELGELLEAYE